MSAARPHVILIGGFLGAGKTTAMLALAHWLADQGIRAGFITNDQGTDLVDTRLMRWCGHRTEEIAGGCFCCRFDELLDATRRLRSAMQLDVFVAEAVGSCTDLAATVTYPLRRLYGADCTVAPLSVVADAVLARRALDLDPAGTFSPAVRYIYRTQLEEADIIVVNKRDIVSAAELDALLKVVRREFPHAEVFPVSARSPGTLDAWFRRILFAEQRSRAVMAVDYDRYAAGEASLGWLNATATVVARGAADGNRWLEQVASDLHRRLAARGAVVAHLKMTLHAGAGTAAVNLVRGDQVPELGVRLAEPVVEAELVVNLRAEAPPGLLEETLRQVLADGIAGWQARLAHVEAIRPARPEPTHRDGVTPQCT